MSLSYSVKALVNSTLILGLALLATACAANPIQTQNLAPLNTDFVYQPQNPMISESVLFKSAAFGQVSAYQNKYVWDFGDGATMGGTFSSHQYQSEGFYEVKLTTDYENGQQTTTTKRIRVLSCVQISNESTIRDDNGDLTYSAIATNAMPFKLAFASIRGYFYDVTDVLVNEVLDNVKDLAPGESWVVQMRSFNEYAVSLAVNVALCYR